MVRIQSMCSYLCGASGVAAVLLGVVMLFGSVAVGDGPGGEPAGLCDNGARKRCDDGMCFMSAECPGTGALCDTARADCGACKCKENPGTVNCDCKL